MTETLVENTPKRKTLTLNVSTLRHIDAPRKVAGIPVIVLKRRKNKFAAAEARLREEVKMLAASEQKEKLAASPPANRDTSRSACSKALNVRHKR